MRELARRTCRALVRMLRRNLTDTQYRTGRIASTTNASCHCITSMAPAMPTIVVAPQMKSMNPQARMFESRSQSDVMRAMSQPTGRWS